MISNKCRKSLAKYSVIKPENVTHCVRSQPQAINNKSVCMCTLHIQYIYSIPNDLK